MEVVVDLIGLTVVSWNTSMSPPIARVAALSNGLKIAADLRPKQGDGLNDVLPKGWLSHRLAVRKEDWHSLSLPLLLYHEDEGVIPDKAAATAFEEEGIELIEEEDEQSPPPPVLALSWDSAIDVLLIFVEVMVLFAPFPGNPGMGIWREVGRRRNRFAMADPIEDFVTFWCSCIEEEDVADVTHSSAMLEDEEEDILDQGCRCNIFLTIIRLGHHTLLLRS